MGYAEFLEEGLGGALSETQRGFVDQIARGTRRLENLVDDLLDFARIDAGTFRLERAPTDFAALAAEVAGSLQPQLDDARVRLALALAPRLPLVALDARRVERVLLNLLNNAIKFTPAGGTITLAAARQGDMLRGEVRDTGIGIAPEHLGVLFQRFRQIGDAARKGGTGLGLSISKALVEAHGGAIGVESVPGEGSTFWFTLPLK
jgi:two-component system phosphate regulon sensor histidine kinase PhoR